MYERFAGNGNVICQLCGKEYGTISATHLKAKHGITVREYQARFKDYPTQGLPWAVRKDFEYNNSREKNDLFKEVIEDNEKLENSVENEPSIIEEIKEEINQKILLLKSNKKEKIIKDNIPFKNKNEIFETLKISFKNLVNNYMISKISRDGSLEYQFITDMADPVRKIEFEFPDTFWHNSDRNQNSRRDILLTQDGWRIIRIKGNSPNLRSLEKKLDVVSD